MGPLAVLIVVLLGVIVPFITIVGLPLGALYLVVRGHLAVKIAAILLVFPWAHFAVQIARHGYVSVQDRPGMPGSTGPTVNPVVWLLLGFVWLLLHLVHRAPMRRIWDHLLRNAGLRSSSPPESPSHEKQVSNRAE
jgi:hypothetical protein